MAEINNTQWRRLQESMRRNRCVLVLGPEAAIDANDPAGPTLTAQAAEHIASELRHSGTIAQADNLPHVAQMYVAEKRSHMDLENFVQDFYLVS